MRLKEIEETILSEVVAHYIHSEQPIGSMQLKAVIDSGLSSATIRNYFRRLVEEGLLTQLHSSGGRIPTYLALRRYWSETLDYSQNIDLDIENAEEIARGYGLYALVQKREPNRLQEVIETSDGRLIALFAKGSVSVPASAMIKRLLTEFTGYDLSDLIAFAQSNRIDALYHQLWQIEEQYIERFNVAALACLAGQNAATAAALFASFYEGKVSHGLRPGVFFEGVVPQGNMALAQQARLNEQPAMLVAFGAITRDYHGFIHHMTKEEL
ncbi:heat-inducible transcription repressor HrcA [Campylobacterota bacterium]|nr:heat-inducible transcription repressor HrcA [Campylobacterota bacterium]